MRGVMRGMTRTFQRRMVLLTLLALSLGATTGCVLLSPENRARMASLQTESEAIAKDIIDLQDEAEFVRSALSEIRAAVKEGRVPLAEGKELLDFYNEKKVEITALIQTNKERGEQVAATLKEIHASGVPMWQVVLAAVLNLGLGVFAAKKHVGEGRATVAAATAQAMTSAVVGGIEKVYTPVKTRVLSGVEKERDKIDLTLLKMVKGEIEKAAERKGVGTALAALVDDQT